MVRLVEISSATGALSDRDAALCIRALMEVGDNTVIPIIQSLISVHGEQAHKIAVEAWDYFDGDLYARNVISRILFPFILSWRNRRDLSYLKYARSASLIELESCVHDRDLRILPNSEICRELRIVDGKELISLDGIEKLIELREITLENLNELEDFDAIGSCSSLTFLTIVNCQYLSNIEFVGKLQYLTNIKIMNCRHLESISGLEDCRNLDSANFEGSDGIDDWYVLNNIENNILLICDNKEEVEKNIEEFALRKIDFYE